MRKALIILLFTLAALPLQAQTTDSGNTTVSGNTLISAIFPPITTIVQCSHDNGGTSTTTVACGLFTPTAGSVIYCSVQNVSVAGLTTVSDSVNGTYQPAVSPLRESSHTYLFQTFYVENVAASQINPTATYGTTGTQGKIICKEIKGTRPKYTLDSSVLQSQAVNGTNPANPNSYTPFANNEIVLSDAYISTGSVTAGTNFTLNNIGTLYSEYWIQGTKTATTGPFSDASAADTAVGMAAFGQNASGTCDATVVIPWDGGTNGNTPAVADLQSSTHGQQANNGGHLNNPPGWVLGGAGAGITYATAAYRPLVATRTCPFYTGSGTGTLGLESTSNGLGATRLNFDTTQSKVTLFACISTSTPVSHAGSKDVIVITGGNNSGNVDYVLLQWNSNGATASWTLEAKASSIASSTAWIQNTAYGIRLEYNKAAAHKGYIYTFSGSNCTGTPTLQETITAGASVAGGGPADGFLFYNGTTSYAAGTVWDMGTAIGDIYYGSSLLP